MAIACLRLFTFLPDPDFNLPFLSSCISLSTFFPAEGEYLRDELFFFEGELFFEADLRLEPDFSADDDFFFEEDFFLLEDLVAI
jgi:hypothetical protein